MFHVHFDHVFRAQLPHMVSCAAMDSSARLWCAHGEHLILSRMGSVLCEAHLVGPVVGLTPMGGTCAATVDSGHGLEVWGLHEGREGAGSLTVQWRIGVEQQERVSHLGSGLAISSRSRVRHVRRDGTLQGTNAEHNETLYAVEGAVVGLSPSGVRLMPGPNDIVSAPAVQLDDQGLGCGVHAWRLILGCGRTLAIWDGTAGAHEGWSKLELESPAHAVAEDGARTVYAVLDAGLTTIPMAARHPHGKRLDIATDWALTELGHDYSGCTLALAARRTTGTRDTLLAVPPRDSRHGHHSGFIFDPEVGPIVAYARTPHATWMVGSSGKVCSVRITYSGLG